MIQKIWYQLVKHYIYIGLFFYHKKITVHGRENIPKKGALLFVSNHKNALIDPLLIATTTTRDVHFLTRASAFKIPLVKWILSTVNMMPIYRIRDGKQAVAKNEQIFKRCFNLFNKGKSMLIFPEGTHDIRRWVRPLSKGFTRITFGALDQNPKLQLTIIPIGLNYAKAESFAEPVSIIYGKPILVNSFYDKDKLAESTLKLKEIVGDALKELTTHIDDIDNYNEIIAKLGYVNYLNPEEVNSKLENLDLQIPNSKLKPKEPSILWKIIYNLVKINSLPALLIWKAVKPKIKEVEFISTTRYAVFVTAIPLFYTLQTIIVAHFFNIKISLMYLGISVVLVLFASKNKS